ncbi:MAG: DUF1456 family protein [Proteobacteria bacterium]|jgi:uncharacterized protein YehS (DUF1456 family)|nr:DUF1456 family protein [Desulfocapsa sp.]MBU3945396.1 DUF1456 family protein [Pseudomonadota bacterium]MCG2744150.1 DUF1456 family protein [Desulfobacteraceae bacterium]MBU4028152.1 DUF1456 family protein [Pseudomonadota bacterium]MBU4043202.1 DUF1456 family protein [Pseudomonadota bacterium]
MTNNDILRRIRYALDLHDATIVEICRLGGHKLEKASVTAFLKKEEEEGYLACSDPAMNAFLDGLIIHKRGQKEDKTDQEHSASPITNNIILKKLRIALELKEDALLEILGLAHATITKAKLSALFRKEGHKNYKECGNQFLRSFLKGLTIRFRDQKDGSRPERQTHS